MILNDRWGTYATAAMPGNSLGVRPVTTFSYVKTAITMNMNTFCSPITDLKNMQNITDGNEKKRRYYLWAAMLMLILIWSYKKDRFCYFKGLILYHIVYFG